MLKTSSNKEQDEFQCVSIDLPGEAIQCTRYKSKIKVILRKHRDVVLDIKLLKGFNYTVESEQSQFYSVRDKTLIKIGKKVPINNEERLHLWVARDFKGHLVLKASNNIIGKYNIEKLDPIKYGGAAKDKPAPLIISLKNDSSQEGNKPIATDGFLPKKTAPFSSSINPNSENKNLRNSLIEELHTIIQVVQVKEEGIPQQILQHFAKGGGKTGLADLDITEVATRNWLYGQLAGTTAYIAENWEWLRNSFDTKTSKGTQLVKARFHKVNGKIRIYFSGYSKVNPVFKQGGHGSSHAKIMQIFAGAGNIKSTFSGIWKGVLGTVKGNALISFIFSSGVALAEWQTDITKDGYDAVSTIFVSLVKSLLTALAVAIIAAIAIIFIAIVYGAALPVLAVGAIVVFGSIGVSYALDVADKVLGKIIVSEGNADGVATYISPRLRQAGITISETWKYLKTKSENEYEEFQLWVN